MPNLNFHKIKKIGVGRYLTKVKSAYMWDEAAQEFYRVWSGASEVSYYDGDRLIGMEEVDDGADALHPSIDTTKEGYTLYGWSDKVNPTTNDRITSYIVDGDPHTLYAIYLPNNLVVLSGNPYRNGGWSAYKENSRNTKYFKGSSCVGAGGYNTWGGDDHSSQPKEGSGSFSITLGEYSNATVKVKSAYAWGQGGYVKYDSRQETFRDETDGDVSWTFTYTSSGSHSMSCKSYAPYDSWCSIEIGIVSVTLSNPEAWT